MLTTSKLRVAALSCLWAAATSANSQPLFEDDFTGASLDLAQWNCHVVWLAPTQMRDQAHFDSVVFTGDTVKLPLETYNPTAMTPGDSFYGTDIVSTTRFSRGSGLVFSARLRMVDDAENPLARGIVGGFFPFETNPVIPGVWDEIDFEALSNDIDDVKNGDEGSRGIVTNVYDEYHIADPGLNPAQPLFVPLPGIDLTEFNTFDIRWLPDRVEWYVNGVLRRTEVAVVPDDPMDVHLNIHVPDPGWPDAYDAGLQRTADPAENRTFFLEVDYVRVMHMNATLAGDYNLDGVADAADYTVWRDTLGLAGDGLAADGNDNDVIDEGDFGIWKAYYGRTWASSAFAPVPEPASTWLLLTAAASYLSRRRRSVRQSAA